ncbi:hypothetical protein [Bradyrhizobium diazoefficiens]|uniref:hypothetical protein n=1 Tax=Bradyrhizobium diazoefficiens TaxID=1355477 RepID=UPI0004B32715|nr:hypothetical protein [Bradyrhizobium diazoefficiens]
MSKMPTPYWPLIECTFRDIAGRNWLRAASRAFGIPQDQLRATYDRNDLSDAVIDDLLARLKRAAVRYEKMVLARAARIHAAAWSVQTAQDDRLRELLQREDDIAVADPQTLFNRLAASFLADLMIDNEAA